MSLWRYVIVLVTKGKNVNVVAGRYTKFGDLLSDLTGRLPVAAMPSYGVRQIYTPTTGRRIRDVGQLKDGGSYVCAGFETFKPMNYGQSAVTAFVGMYTPVSLSVFSSFPPIKLY